MLPFAAQSQIVIEASQIKMAGNVAYNSRDTEPDSTIMVGGTGMQTWDFSGLHDHEQDVLRFSEAAGLPYASEFSEANIGVQVNDGDTVVYIFIAQDAEKLATYGSYGNFDYPPFSFNTTFKYTPPLTSIRFPMQYNDAFDETVKGKIQLPGTAIGISSDSVRAITTNRRSVNIDAYGTLIAPTGTYNVLRSKEVEITTDTIYILSVGNWLPYLGGEPDTLTLYSFWTNQNGLGFPVVQMSVKNDGTVKEVGWLKSFISGTKDNPQLVQLGLSPNPTSQYLNIVLPDGHQEGSLEIYDLNGRQLRKAAVATPRQQLNVHGLPAGGYVLVLKDGQGRLIGFERFAVAR